MSTIKAEVGRPSEIQMRYDELMARRRAESMNPDEYSELLDLTERVEKLEAERIEYLAESARLRGVSLV